MNFTDLVERHPEVMRDRYALSFSKQRAPAEVADAFSRFSVVMLKNALAPELLKACAEVFQRYVQSLKAGIDAVAGEHRRLQGANGEAHTGSWYSPWAVRDQDNFPTATVISAVIRSWVWDVVEEICGSSHIVILLKWCTARHAIDQSLGIGAHQDAKVVASAVPFSIWIPLQEVVPCVNSGLGFVVPGPDRLLPTLPHDDVGSEYVLSDLARLWIPPYELGDLSVHSRFSPHFTTGYGTLSDRFSLEIRAMPRYAAPQNYLDPAIYVSRRNGVPTIVETRSSAKIGPQGFFDSPGLSGATSRELRKVLL